MPRLAFLIVSFGVGSAAVGLSFGGCEASTFSPTFGLDAGNRVDGALVDPLEGGAPLDGGGGVVASCESYCSLVSANCAGEHAQYASEEDCLAFCRFLPLQQPAREVEEKYAPSVACRQYWADSPSRTDPAGYCLAAGPFGGGVCGDRCTAFCDVVLAACSPEAPDHAVYGTTPECATACVSFSYREDGGEAPTGPEDGDTLNCRLYQLRAATKDPGHCGRLRPDAGACSEDAGGGEEVGGE